VFFAFVGSSALEELFMHVFPVAEAALHNSGDEREIFSGSPVLHEQREVQMVINEEIVLLLVVRLHV